ncbi:MAG: 4-hydroxy-tetrahydrodipicolinate reductase [Deltaproteobacteria bacterium]|jgi:4-hydroxy-tetrahydrodipicolinate reductase|nr:4-hydroxy-tetrahydrodipicolinate reductase [Deltaproteobacteria bacterium]
MKNKLIVMGAAGRMGSMIAALAEEEGFSLVAVADRAECLGSLTHWACLVGSEPEPMLAAHPQAVIIDFTAPEAALRTARLAARYGNPLVSGVTGLSAEQKRELERLAAQTPILWSPNMSLGVSVLSVILPRLARMLGPDYDLELVEIHHNKKRTHPAEQPCAWLRAWPKAAAGNWTKWPVAGVKA